MAGWSGGDLVGAVGEAGGLGMIGVGYGLISGVTVGAIASYWPKVEFGRMTSRVSSSP